MTEAWLDTNEDEERVTALEIKSGATDLSWGCYGLVLRGVPGRDVLVARKELELLNSTCI